MTKLLWSCRGYGLLCGKGNTGCELSKRFNWELKIVASAAAYFSHVDFAALTDNEATAPYAVGPAHVLRG